MCVCVREREREGEIPLADIPRIVVTLLLCLLMYRPFTSNTSQFVQ